MDMTRNSKCGEQLLYDIANKARKIANSIGYPLIKEEYYSDKTIGHEYKYDQLQISCYSDNVYVYLNNIKVLSCDFNNCEINYVYGKWIDIVEIIYQQIDSILEEKNKKELPKKSIVESMLKMEEYFKHYLEFEKRAILIDELNIDLNSKGISVSSKEYYRTIRNLCTGDYEDSAIKERTYIVSYYSNEVAQFNGNTFNIFPNISWYADKFVTGEWTDIFQKSILQIILKEKIVTQRTVDNISEEILTRIKKRNK